MQVERLFSKNSSAPYHGIKFEKRPVDLQGQGGCIRSIIVPKSWSNNAACILARKYCRKTDVPAAVTQVAEDGVPKWLWRSQADSETIANLKDCARSGPETDARDVFNRLSGSWTYAGWKGGYFDSESDARNFYTEICRMLALQMLAPNSPQWFNTGLNWAYGICQSTEGYQTADGEYQNGCGVASVDRSVIHSCFIQSVHDDLVRTGGVMDLLSIEAKIAKFGSGTGANFSAVRGKNEELSGGGFASGVLAALKASDRAAMLVTARGSTRRSSKMVLVDADHPEIEDFIDWKVREEHKVAALVSGSAVCNSKLKTVHDLCLADRELSILGNDAPLRRAIEDAGAHKVPENAIANTVEAVRSGSQWRTFDDYDVHWDSDGYGTVSGQNSNNSVRVTNAFMNAVSSDDDWDLVCRTDATVAKTIKAKGLWEKIGYSAWAAADPGLQFDTTINDWHTCANSDPINGSNSCSEFLFLDDTGATLASLNLRAFAQSRSELDIQAFAHAVRLATLMLEISVSIALYPSTKIARKTDSFRPLGLGFTNLGAFLMAGGLPYDSDEGRETCAGISALMTGLAYSTSAEIAADLTTFEGYSVNRDSMLRVIRNHRRAAYGAVSGYEGLAVRPVPLTGRACPQPELIQAARQAWDKALSLGERHGYRNAQTTAIAPTGTIGLIMDCDTMGIEPDYALVKHKSLAAGGSLRIANKSISAALESLGYDSNTIEQITNYIVGTPRLGHSPRINRKSLKARGFTEQMIKNAERALSTAFDIRAAISPHNLGLSFCKKALGLSEETLSAPDFDLLEYLGFGDDDVCLANHYCCGHKSAEGASGLSPRHYPIFDCAVSGGEYGMRTLSTASHLKMMAAAQPFISGGISKTVNLPQSATVDECIATFEAAYMSGLKSIALYRDGSKLSQPMMASTQQHVMAKGINRANAATEPNFKNQAENFVKSEIERRCSALPIEKRQNGAVTQYPASVASAGPPSLNDRSDDQDQLTINSMKIVTEILVAAVALGFRHGVDQHEFETVFRNLNTSAGSDRVHNETITVDLAARKSHMV